MALTGAGPSVAGPPIKAIILAAEPGTHAPNKLAAILRAVLVHRVALWSAGTAQGSFCSSSKTCQPNHKYITHKLTQNTLQTHFLSLQETLNTKVNTENTPDSFHTLQGKLNEHYQIESGVHRIQLYTPNAFHSTTRDTQQTLPI